MNELFSAFCFLKAACKFSGLQAAFLYKLRVISSAYSPADICSISTHFFRATPSFSLKRRAFFVLQRLGADFRCFWNILTNPQTARTAGRCVCQGARTTPWLFPAFSPQRPKSFDFALLGVLSEATNSRWCSLYACHFLQRSCTSAQRPVLGFRWVRARLYPENRTQPRHAAHAGGWAVSYCASWNASKRFRMRSCSHSASSFASFCS